MCEATNDSTYAVPDSVDAPSQVRGFVHSTLCREHAQTAEPVVTLLSDELATQALLYGAPPVTIALRCSVTEVTVEVADGTPEMPAPDTPDHELSMLLVDKISHRWGTRRTGAGKVVWCTVPSGALPSMRSYASWAAVDDAQAARSLVTPGRSGKRDGENPAV